MAEDDEEPTDIFGGLFDFDFEDIFTFDIEDFIPEWDYSGDEGFEFADTLDSLISLDLFGDVPKPKDTGDHTTISWDELETLGKTSNPYNRKIIDDIMLEIEESDMTMEEIQKADFERPYTEIISRDADGRIVRTKSWMGIQDGDDAMHKAKVELEAKGVSAPSGGGGLSSSYGAEIDSDQWQRIRRGELTIEEAEWENDDSNYDPETGEMYDYFTSPDDEEDDDNL